VGRRSAITASQSHRPRQLAHQEVPLRACRGGPARVAEALRLIQLSLQLVQPGLVGGLGRGVQQLAGVTQIRAHLQFAPAGRSARPRGRRPLRLAAGCLQVDRVELPARIGQEPGQQAQALGVGQAGHRAFEADRPVLAFPAEQVPRRLLCSSALYQVSQPPQRRHGRQRSIIVLAEREQADGMRPSTVRKRGGLHLPSDR